MKKAIHRLLILTAFLYIVVAKTQCMGTNIENEIWKSVVGYEGLYEISNYGNLKRLVSVKCHKERFLSKRVARDKYLRFHLSKNALAKPLSAHRLVAIHFIPNPLNLPQVNHKDGNKQNNFYKNLEWATPSQNVKHSYDVLKRQISSNAKEFGGKHPAAVPIIQYSLTGEFIKEWSSAIEIQRELKLHSPNVIACCRGIKQTTCGGFIFKHKFKRNVRRSRKV